MNYQDYLKSNDWKQKRKYKRRNHNRCGICAATDNLDVHHLNYRDLYNVDQSDLRVLCRRCHFLCHDLMRDGKVRFTSTNHHSRFAILKTEVKRALGILNKNMFTN